MPWPTWTEIFDILKAFGLNWGLFVLFFFMMHGWVYSLYFGRLKDRQKEIDRIAAENHDYRERFGKLLDRHFEITGKKND